MATSRVNDQVIGEIVDDLVSRGADDWVNMHELGSRVVANASLHGIEMVEDEEVDASLEVIRLLLTTGLMVAGDMPKMDSEAQRLFKNRDWQGLRELRGTSPKSLVAWDLNPAAAYERIEREWRALGRPLHGPEICWLENTPAGNERGLAVSDEVNRRFNWPPPGT